MPPNSGGRQSKHLFSTGLPAAKQEKNPWIFPDFPTSKDFPWLFTEFPDFSLTLIFFPLTFPWLMATLISSCKFHSQSTVTLQNHRNIEGQ